jgi:hypothetical protein
MIHRCFAEWLILSEVTPRAQKFPSPSGRVRVRVAIVTFALTRRFAAASPGGRGKNSRRILGPLARVMYAIRHYFNHPASR